MLGSPPQNWGACNNLRLYGLPDNLMTLPLGQVTLQLTHRWRFACFLFNNKAQMSPSWYQTKVTALLNSFVIIKYFWKKKCWLGRICSLILFKSRISNEKSMFISNNVFIRNASLNKIILDYLNHLYIYTIFNIRDNYIST